MKEGGVVKQKADVCETEVVNVIFIIGAEIRFLDFRHTCARVFFFSTYSRNLSAPPILMMSTMIIST